ncbi:MAG: polymerase sigma factor [Bacteroidetes bacterium]|nr:polymerase sigma factor [Bacteroidota bacterium]
MDKVQTRKDEIIKTVSTPAALQKCKDMFINKSLYRTWQDECVDESTGKVVSVDRKEVICDKGEVITSDLISELLFNLEAKEITEIEVSNQQRAAFEAHYGTSIYWVVAEIGPKAKKVKFLFSAVSIPVALDIIKDYIELNFNGSYNVISMKEFKTDVVLDDKLSKKEEEVVEDDDDAIDNDKFYQIMATITNSDAYTYTANAVIKSVDLDHAMEILRERIKSQRPEEEFTIKLEEAKILQVDYIIEEEFLAAYAPE